MNRARQLCRTERPVSGSIQSAPRRRQKCLGAAIEHLETRRLLASLVWSPQVPNGHNDWDYTTPNWIDLSTNAQVTFNDGDDVLFNDLGAATVEGVGGIQIDSGGVSPGQITFDTQFHYRLFVAEGPIGLGGTGPLTKNGSGTLRLQGGGGGANQNTYAGATFINAGSVHTLNGAIPDLSAVFVAGGAAWRSSSFERIGSLAGSGNVEFGGDDFSGVNRLETGGNGASTTFSGVLIADQFDKLGTGTMTLAGADPNVGQGTISVNAGTLVLAKDPGVTAWGVGPLPKDPSFGDINVYSGAELRWESPNQIHDDLGVYLMGGSLDLNGQDETLRYMHTVEFADSALQTGSGDLTITEFLTHLRGSVSIDPLGAINVDRLFQGGWLDISGELNVGAGGADIVWAVDILDGGSFNTTSGVLLVRLGGINVQAGGELNVGSGGLILGGVGVSVTIGLASDSSDPGRMSLAGDVSIVSPAMNILSTGSGTLAGVLQLLSGDHTVDTTTENLLISATVRGGGGLTKVGSGILTLTGDNEYGGGTSVSSGILRVTTDTALGTGAVEMSGGSLELVRSTALNLANTVNVTAGSPGIVVDDGTPGTGGTDAEVTHVIGGDVNILPGATLNTFQNNQYNLRFSGSMINDGTLRYRGRVDIAGAYSSPGATIGTIEAGGGFSVVFSTVGFTNGGLHIMNNLPTVIEAIAAEGAPPGTPASTRRDPTIVVENGPAAPVTLVGIWKGDGNGSSPGGNNNNNLMLRNGARFIFSSGSTIDTTVTTGGTPQPFRIFTDIGGGGTVEFEDGFIADPPGPDNEFATLRVGGAPLNGSPLLMITRHSQNLPVSLEQFQQLIPGTGGGGTWSVRTNAQVYAGLVNAGSSPEIETLTDLTLSGATPDRLSTLGIGSTLTVSNGGTGGKLVLQQSNTLAGGLSVLGVVDHDGFDLTVNRLSGSGSIVGSGILFANGVTQPGSTLGNDIGTLNTSDTVLTATSNFSPELDAAGDQLRVTGTVTLNGGLLTPTGLAPANSYVIIDNDGTEAVIGTFNGLAEGATVNVDGKAFTITYAGGDGNDVVLFNNSAPTADAQSVSVPEDGEVLITLSGSDAQTAAGDLIFTVTSLPVHGVLYEGTTLVEVGDQFTGAPTLRFVPGATCDHPGSDAFTFMVTDDGNPASSGVNVLTSDPATVSIGIIPAVADGAVSVADGIVRIGGTASDDTLVLTGSGGILAINGTPTGISLSSINEIRVWSRDGNDIVDASALSISTFIHGGPGNDQLVGGGNSDVLIGSGGNDTVTGGAGDDFLIGGDGADRLVGSAGHDILVAGDWACEWSLADLQGLSELWATTQSGVVEEEVDADEVVTDDDFDMLTGSSGLDWFIISDSDTITDLASSLKKGDLITVVS